MYTCSFSELSSLLRDDDCEVESMSPKPKVLLIFCTRFIVVPIGNKRSCAGISSGFFSIFTSNLNPKSV